MKLLILSFLFVTGYYQCDAANLMIYQTSEQYKNISLDTPRDLLAYANKSLITVFYTFGFGGSPFGDIVKLVIQALSNAIQLYTAQGTVQQLVNVVLFNWVNEAANSTLLGTDLSYARAVTNAEILGSRLGGVMVDLIQNTEDEEGLDPDKIYLVGHSLGAHLWGQTGRSAKALGYEMPYIVGLDPAGPFFEDDPTQLSLLDKDCAGFVQITHTDLVTYGINKSTGHVDIYPNMCFNDTCVQPGCNENSTDLCSHNRAPELFVAALQNSSILLALAAFNYYNWVALNGSGTNITGLGLVADFIPYGNCYCSTTGSPPYGKGTAGLRP